MPTLRNASTASADAPRVPETWGKPILVAGLLAAAAAALLALGRNRSRQQPSSSIPRRSSLLQAPDIVRPPRRSWDEEMIDEAGAETFPASDPPSFTPITHDGRPQR